MSHTPKPWVARDWPVPHIDGHFLRVAIHHEEPGRIDGEHVTVDALSSTTIGTETCRANVALICAAPELLKALQFCVQAMRTAGLEGVPGGLCAQAAREARAAIAKAQGEE